MYNQSGDEAFNNDLSAYKFALDESAIIAITDLRGKIKHVNGNFCEISGYSEAELLGQDYRIVNSGYHAPECIREMWETIANGNTWKGEMKNKGKEGQVYWVEMTITPFLDEAGKPYQYLAISVDITERKKTEHELINMNRLFAFISAINQAIVQTENEAQLLQVTCRIAVEIGQFKMAWIGLLDENGLLNIVNVEGDENSATELLKHDGTDYKSPEMRNTPIGKVLRTGKYAVSNHVQNDPVMEQWSEEWVKHDIKAIISLPLFKSGKVSGVFGLDSNIENFFDTKEIGLLKEAVGDISFALEHFSQTRKHREAEAKLRENEIRYSEGQSLIQAVYTASLDAVIIIDEEGIITKWDPKSEILFGWKDTEVLGSKLSEIIVPERYRAMHESGMKRYHKTGVGPILDKTVEMTALQKGGSELDVSLSITSSNINGKLHFIGFIRDISEKKRAEQQKEFAHNNLNALINNTQDLMWSVDRDFNLITSNQPFEKMCIANFGRIIEKGDNLLEIAYTPDMREHYKLQYERAFAGEHFSEVEYFDTPFEFWTEISYHPITKGNEIIGSACHSRDITEKRKAEADLQLSEIRLKNSQKIAHLGSWDLDLETGVGLWSDESCRIYGLDQSETLQTFEAWLDFVHPDDRQFVMLKTAEQQIDLGEMSYDHRIILKDGSVKYLHVSSTYKLDKNGKPVGLYGIALDITQQKLVELELENTLKELEMRVEARTKELSEKNRDILDSINYAKRIQLGLLSRPLQLLEIFPQSFMISKACGILSGDFFWCYQNRYKKFIAVADCTGHGVPGALMSIIGNNLLNQIIVEERIDNPSEILELLDIRLKQAVKGDDNEVKDGMDIALCIVDTYFNEVHFAGAYQSLYICETDGKIHELAGTRCSVGGGVYEESKRFETKRYAFRPGQCMYLSSDGYYSQFGGTRGKKFMRNRFVQSLEEIQHQTVDQQKASLQNIFSDWKGDHEQVDDVLVVGIKL